MTNPDNLKALLEKVESGEVSFFKYYGAGDSLWRAFDTFDDAESAWRAYNGSMDAALSLMEAVLPDWGWRKDHYNGESKSYNSATMWVTEPNKWRRGQVCKYDDGNDARALLIAIIKALISQAEEKQ